MRLRRLDAARNGSNESESSASVFDFNELVASVTTLRTSLRQIAQSQLDSRIILGHSESVNPADRPLRKRDGFRLESGTIWPVITDDRRDTPAL